MISRCVFNLVLKLVSFFKMLLHVHVYSHVVVSGDLVLPSHITVLHVEQEVIGDDTKAIDSVLECDVKRTALLKEEAELSAKTQSTRYFSRTAICARFVVLLLLTMVAMVTMARKSNCLFDS